MPKKPPTEVLGMRNPASDAVWLACTVVTVAALFGSSFAMIIKAMSAQ